MDDILIFSENFFSALEMLGGAPKGGSLGLRRGAGAFATGLPYAGENYALFDSSSSDEEISKTLGFFEARKLPFIALQLPGPKASLLDGLAGKNMPVRAEYLAMSIENLTVSEKIDPWVRAVKNESDVIKWAEAAWTGFEGDLPVPDEYLIFVKYLHSRSENDLYYLEREGVSLCSALLHFSQGTGGLYYFATRPEARRQGLAVRLMDSLRKQARCRSMTLVLLATEMGAAMYQKYGFKELLRVPIMPSSDDI